MRDEGLDSRSSRPLLSHKNHRPHHQNHPRIIKTMTLAIRNIKGAIKTISGATTIRSA